MKMLTLLGIFMFSFAAHAISGRTTYQAKIVKPDGYPLEASSVNFRFTILDPAASCVLYIEDYAAVNMTGTGGLISFALGAGTRSYPVSSTTLASVFDNSTVSFPCQSPGIYNPTSVDNRKIVMQFQDSSGWQTLPAMAINAVPYAMYAGKSENATQLNGKSDTAFVENATLAALNCNATTHAITFNGVSFSCIPVGSGSSGITSVTTSGTVLTTGGTASAPVISITAATMSSDGYLTSLDYAEFKAKLSASSTQIVNTLGYAPVSGAAVATQINNSQLSGDVSGTVSANSVISVGGKTSSQISTSVDDTLAATSSATADTIVKRNSSGNFTANDIYANAAKINYVDIYKPSTSFNIRLQAPTSLAANYTLNLPTASGTSGQVLSTDGSGNLSWINPSTGSVVSVSATAPLASTGGSNPTISITQSSSSTDGYLSSTDFNTFNNKQAATSAAIITTLGYTPADNAASGTYAQKANNLSDLTNVVTARTNLGLGTFATASSIDLSSASATGIIAEARLQTQTNVTSGTQYTKVTVDGKGRVTSGAQISSSDVTTALGYTPSNAASAGITTLNGSSSATQTFAIGTSGNSPAFNTAAGTHTLNIPLANTGSVTAGLLSNTDYTTFNNKQTATSAAIIATLGYTPADNAASGTYLVKASNLSDLTNVATARSNLGLGTFATASSVDLGSASATGTLAIARLPSFSGDATIAAASNTIVLSNSGVAAGTYTKLTVDAKGRVTSSAALASSDVTTALGYTPANSASGVTLLNGSASQTQTFSTANTGTAFGIATSNGVHTISIPLAASSSVVGGLLSNADYATFTNKQNATSAAIIATLGYTPANATSATQWTTNGSNIYYNTGNIGVGILNPTAKLELASGTASVAPLKFTSGTLLSSAQSGTMEYDGFNYYLTDSTNTRRTIATGSSAGSIDNASTINSTGNISMVPVGSVIVSSTTASTNSNTGALVVKGGLGVAGNINTAGNLNVSGSSVIDGSLKLSTMTSGSMLFAGANGTVTQDNSNLYWDEANKRLGIGSNSPAQTLSVSGTSYFSGNVGIGTSAPVTTLHVVSKQSAAAVHPDRAGFVLEAEGTSVGGRIAAKVYSDTENPLFVAYRARGTKANPQPLLSGDLITAISPVGFDGSNWQTGAHVRFHTTENWNGSAIGSAISFRTVTNGTSTTLDRMRIDHNGNVGIGTSTPSAKLDVNDGAGRKVAFSPAGISGDFANLPLIHLENTNNVADDWFLVNAADKFHLTTEAASGTEKLTVTSSGNVGIGTSSPAARLDLGTASSNTTTAILARAADPNFRMEATTGVATNVNGDLIGKLGMRYATSGVDTALLKFYRGTTSYDGAVAITTSGTDRFIVKGNGNVGIGTTSPKHKLDVNGSIGIFEDSQTLDSRYFSGLIERGWELSNGSISYVSGSTVDPAPVGNTITQTTTFTWAYGPKVALDITQNYLFEAWVRCAANCGNSAATYLNVQQYDANGNNISGDGTDWHYPNSAFTAPTSWTKYKYIIGPYGGSKDHSSNAKFISVGFIANYTTGTATIQFAGMKISPLPKYPGDSLILTNSGNVGIGTMSPFSRLHVYTGNASASTFVAVNTTAMLEDDDYALLDLATAKTGLAGVRFNAGSDTTGSVFYYGPTNVNGERMAMFVSGTEKLSILPNGNVGIGTSAPSYTLDVSGTLRVKGTAYTDGGYTTWTAASDIRLKDIHGNYNRGLDDILGLNIIRFQYKSDNPVGLDSSKEFVGVTAQNLQQGIPEAVTEETNGKLKGYLTINTTPVLWTLVNAVKQLYKQVMVRFESQDRQIASIVESKADKAETDAKIKMLETKAAEVDSLKVENAAKAKEIDALKSYLCSKDPTAPICK